MQGWAIVLIAIFYLLFLFVVASYGDRRRRGQASQRARPAIYALSLAIYCTSWTFFGSVGLATTSGFDFLAIYLGPVLMITVGYPVFSRIIRIAKAEKITSIADFLAARYGKSMAVGATAATIAVLGTVPYIALQLKAVSTSVGTMVAYYRPGGPEANPAFLDTSFYIALLLAVFAILFGTRHADATEHQDGLMLAVATESLVKLAAFLLVGFYVTFVMFTGPGDIIERAQASEIVSSTFSAGINPGTFAVFTLLSFFAFVLLPRQFHVGVVENHSPQEAERARWLFPLYLVLINLFVVPVALGGLLTFGDNVDADAFVLALPIKADNAFIYIAAFLGGLSAATAMVIVACVALAIMISNNLVLPLILRRDTLRPEDRQPANMGQLLLNIRRGAIFVIIALAYIYYEAAGDSAALASIGLLSFAAVAQFAPSLFGGLIWREGTARGALWGMAAGFLVWFYTLFLPTLLDPGSLLLTEGLFGIGWLHPQHILGTDFAPLNHGVFWSLLVNTLFYVAGSLSRVARPLERMQAHIFVPRERAAVRLDSPDSTSVTYADLEKAVARYLGEERARRALHRHLEDAGHPVAPLEKADTDLINFAEQLLASAIGAASSRLVISLILKKHEASPRATMQLLDDASEALQYNRDLMQTALDQVEQGISVFDNEYRLNSWNRQFRALLDLEPDIGQAGTPLQEIADAISQKSKPFTGTKDKRQPAGTDYARRLVEYPEPWQIRIESTGKIIEIHTKNMPDGGLVVSWNDITERAETARALQQANESLEQRVRERTEELTQLNTDLGRATAAADAANIGKTRFLAAVSHDILQPLNAARLYTSSLVERLGNSKEQELAENVDHSLESVEDILSAVLAISRLDTGTLKPSITDVSVDRLFERLEVGFRPIAEEKGLGLIVHSSDFHVRSDYNLLRRLLQNLVSNAIKYTTEGSVTLDCRVKGNRLLFEVTDTGLGIEEEDRLTIFDEFNRLDAGKRLSSGLGLGLSIVRRISKALDHPVELTSQPARGSCFTVSATLAVPKRESGPDAEAPQTVSTRLNGLRVLCIDNDESILEGMRVLLEGWNCLVETATGTDAALGIEIKTRRLDVVIADYHLNDQTGLDAFGTIRAQAGSRLPGILLTAERSPEVKRKAEDVGLNVLYKPVKPAALRTLLARVSQAGVGMEETLPAAAE